MYGSESFCITHHVAERYQCVHFVFWWLLCSRSHIEIVENDIEGGIICLADISLNSHYLIHGLGISQSVTQSLDRIDNAL